jgi:hypothetical protein
MQEGEYIRISRIDRRYTTTRCSHIIPQSSGGKKDTRLVHKKGRIYAGKTKIKQI